MTIEGDGALGVVDLLFGIFVQSWVPWLLSGLIIVVAIAIWVDFRRRVRKVVGGLSDATEVLEEVIGPAAFRLGYAGIYRKLAENPIVGIGWRAYAPTLAPAPGNDDVIGYQRRPREHLNESLLAHAGLDLRLYVAIPNYLVGAGLLFTFLGLVAALYFASSGVAAANVEDAQSALRSLLAAATFKFVTSIAGLGTSIVFSWREKRQVYVIKQCIGRLCAVLEERMVPITSEGVAVTQLDEMRAQTAHLASLGRKLLIAVPEAIEDRLAEELSEAMQPMRVAMGEAAKRLGRLDEIVAERLAGPSIELPANATDDGEAAPRVVRVAPAVRSSDQVLVNETRAVRGAIEELAATMNRVAARPAGRVADGDASGAIEGYIALFDSSAEGIESLHNQLDSSLADVHQALSALMAVARDASAEELDELAAALAQGVELLAESRSDLQTLGRMFRGVAADSRTLSEGRHAAGVELDHELAESIDRLGRGVDGFNEQMRAFVRRMDEKLARSSRVLQSTADDLQNRADGD